MVFVFFQNNKCIADVAILLVFVVIARSLQFQMPYKREEKKRWSLQSVPNWRENWQQQCYLNRSLGHFVLKSPPMSREFCRRLNCAKRYAAIIWSSEWVWIEEVISAKTELSGRTQSVCCHSWHSFPWPGSAHGATPALACAVSGRELLPLHSVVLPPELAGAG